ncbi:MAG TPA: DUF971 domain-containing protein [Planctomycetota bacterium]|nr:DUF971 domain-containing protein [Planctomycetota bacterium]
MDSAPTPLSAKRAAPDARRPGRFALETRWSDARICIYPWGYLRDLCPCAQCRPELVARVQEGKGADAPDGPARQVVQLQHVGNYALGVRWADGHESILPWDYLRSLDPELPVDVRVAIVRERG